MKDKAKKIMKHPLIKGSSVVFIGSFLASFLNWFFNLLIGGRHLLSVQDYGLYQALVSLLTLISVLSSTLSGTFAKFAARYHAREDKEGLAKLFYGAVRPVTAFGGVILIILLLLTPALSSFLHVADIRLLVLIDVTIFFTIVVMQLYGMLQGQMRFYLFSFFQILSPVIKIIFGLSLVFLGFKLFGVIVGVFLSVAIVYVIIILLFLKNYKRVSYSKELLSSLYKELGVYGLPFLLLNVGITVFSNTDMLFVRHYMTASQAGEYAALSVMGKAIFYLISPIYFVFFPLIAQKKERREKVYGTLLLAGGVISALSLSISFVYFLFPQIVLKYLFPGYSSIAQYLGPYSLYMFVFLLASLFNNFLLSMGKTGVYKINLILAALFVVLIIIFHASFYQIIGVLFSVSLLLFLSLLIYFKINENS